MRERDYSEVVVHARTNFFSFLAQKIDKASTTLLCVAVSPVF